MPTHNPIFYTHVPSSDDYVRNHPLTITRDVTRLEARALSEQWLAEARWAWGKDNAYAHICFANAIAWGAR